MLIVIHSGEDVLSHKLGSTPTSWKTKKQDIISQSSAAAKCIAMANAIDEVV